MHVVMLSDHETAGGAAVAASRLAEGLLNDGVRITRLVGRRDRHAHRWATRELHVKDRRPARWARSVLPADLGEALRQRAFRRQLSADLRALQPDVINIHNVHEAGWSPDLLETCRNIAPVVWTLHDMWSFTGRCAYNYDCPKFVTGCDATCPTPEEYPALEPARIRPAWERRRQLFAASMKPCAVTPSRWLGQAAQTGLWSGHRTEVIPYGLNLETFAPLGREESRRELGITAPGPILLISAVDFSDRRKGADLLAAALQSYPGRPPTLLTMGEGTFPVSRGNVIPLGRITDDRRKRCAYSAADLFVHPARADNLPNVLLETIACGTPALGFAVGGVPDVVRPGVTGWLASEISADALAVELATALDALARGHSFRESCRAVATEEYALSVQARRYQTLFEELLAA